MPTPLLEVSKLRVEFPGRRGTLVALDDVSFSIAPGEVPNPLNPPSGCTFNLRCPHANERCRGERPKLLDIDGVRVACHPFEERRI